MDIPPSFALPLSPILLPDTRPDTHPTGGRPTPRLSPLSPGPRAQCSTDRNLPVLRARTDCTQAYPQNPPHSSLPPIVVCVQTCKTPPPGKGRVVMSSSIESHKVFVKIGTTRRPLAS